MSIASSSARAEHDRRIALLARMRNDLNAAGVPVEAHPRRLPSIYNVYTVRGPAPARNPIQVLLGVRRFMVPSQVTGNVHSTVIPWDGDAARAWEHAKREARW